MTFTQCICDVGVKDTNVDVSILETIRGAIRTFDESHCTHFEDQIPHLKASLVQDVILAESKSPVTVLKDDLHPSSSTTSSTSGEFEWHLMSLYCFFSFEISHTLIYHSTCIIVHVS